MKDKRVSGSRLGGSRRHGDPPAWLDGTLPLEERRRLLDVAIRAIAASQLPEDKRPRPPDPDDPGELGSPRDLAKR